MYVKIKYFRSDAEGYTGQDYTYSTDLPLFVGAKVICPTYKGPNRGIVTQIDVPDGEIDERWRDKIKPITEYDFEDVEGR